MSDIPGSARHRRRKGRRGVVGPLVSAASVVLATAPVVWVMSGARDAVSLTGPQNDQGTHAELPAKRVTKGSRDDPSRSRLGPGMTVTITTNRAGKQVTTVTTLNGELRPRATSATASTDPTVTTVTTAPTWHPTVPPSTRTSRKPKPPSNTQTRRPSHNPTSTATETEPPPQSDSMNYQEREVLRYTNLIREEVGCGPVKADSSLIKSSGGHAEDMVDRHFFDHVNPDGESPYDRMAQAGFHGSAAAENIAAGYDSPEKVMEAWMRSEGHRANILNCNYNRLGVGYDSGRIKRDYGPGSWVQNFGRS